MRTWLDVASDWVSGSLPCDKTESGFSREQTALLKKALEECFKVFAEHIDARFSRIEDGLVAKVLADDILHGVDECGAAIVGSFADEKAAGIISTRTRSRRNRRKKHLRELRYSRESLLALKLGALMSLPPHDLNQRLLDVESLVYSNCMPVNKWETDNADPGCLAQCWTSGISADVLSKQCKASRTLQRAWRRYTSSKSLDVVFGTQPQNKSYPHEPTTVKLGVEDGDDSVAQSIASAQVIAEMINSCERGKMRRYVFVKPATRPSEPKRPPSAYFLFAQEEKSKLHGQVPSDGWNAFAKATITKWKEIDQSAYLHKAQTLMDIYEQELREYMRASRFSVQ